MANPEAQPAAEAEGMRMTSESEEGNEILTNILFVPILDGKGRTIGYKSSSPDRKVIKLVADSESPIEGQEYDIEILDDTEPGDPSSGTLFARIKKAAHVLTAEEKEHWESLDANINEAHTEKRQAFEANVAVKGLQTMQETMTAVDNPSNRKLKEKFSKGKKTHFAGDVLGRSIEKAQGEQRDHSTKYSELLGTDMHEQAETEALIELRERNLKESTQKMVYLTRQTEDLKALRLNLKKSFAQKSLDNKAITTPELDTYRQIEEEIEEVKDLMEMEVESSPEAWYGSHLRLLKDYRKQYSDGSIVETPSVEKKAEKLADIVISGQPIFIHGHLGAGKTEIARHIATEYLKKPYHMISGSRHMSPSEIYGHDVLTTAGSKQDQSVPFDKKAEDALAKWEQENTARLEDLSHTEKEGERNRAQDRIIASLQSGATISQFHPGPIYRAMELGEPLIIDELNAIPHDVLIGLNDLLTRKPGDKVKIQQDSAREIIVAPGFCVMMTGNINNRPVAF
jgi:MoxR-like ATPase